MVLMTLPETPMDAPLSHLEREGAPTLAYRSTPGHTPGFVWLGGFRSDMDGGKATTLHTWAAQRGHAFTRFDYRGHGASEGAFGDALIGDWIEDSLAILDRVVAPGRHILVGSSMGAWMALHAAIKRADRVAGLILIAPAPDFTAKLMQPELPAEAREALERDGVYLQPSPYDDEPYPITKAMLDDGAKHTLLDQPVPFDGPVTILHGLQDSDVPFSHACLVQSQLRSPDVRMIVIKDGDHRLSRSQDLQRLLLEAAIMAETCS